MQHRGLRQHLWLPSLFLLAACSPSAFARPQTTITAVSLTPSSFPASTLTVLPTPMASAIPPVSPTPVPVSSPAHISVCLETRGAMVADAVDSTLLSAAIAMQVYLPPCYVEEGQSYPVLYLLHGLQMDEKTWGEIGVNEAADTLIAGGNIPPLIIVMPHDRENEGFGGAIVKELIPYVDRHYRTRPERAYRALGGMSYGAGWVVDVGFQHPKLFSALGLHSLAIFYRDEARVSGWLNKIPADLQPRIYLDIGTGDSLLVSADWLDEALTKRGLAHEYHLNPGLHSRAYWAKHLPEYLQWYTQSW